MMAKPIGRRPLPADRRLSELVALKLTVSEADALRAYAYRRMTTSSALLRTWVRRALATTTVFQGRSSC